VGSIITGAVVGIVVAVAGAVANYYLTKRRDERHWEREDELRFQKERFEAYSRFMRTLQIGIRLPTSNPPTAEERITQITTLTDGYAETLLLSSPPVRDAAMKVFRAHIRSGGHRLRAPLTEEERSTDPETLRLRYMQAFENEVRKELKIPEPPSPG
jgi:hypothetical protein